MPDAIRLARPVSSFIKALMKIHFCEQAFMYVAIIKVIFGECLCSECLILNAKNF